ncbi:hypothetical protein [Pseudalkalibacillus sp. JSM 102089]|uniref:hypothetical protein n=1 Tax=Pseudalkalibacillus sp. JSM 102089 TaxID=3229856 RepID=UPI003525E041
MKKGKDIDEFTFSYISKLQLPKNNRHYIFGFLFIYLDIMGIIPLISAPFSIQLFWAGIIPIIAINLWGLVCFIAPYKFEHAFYLFFGVLGLVTTYIYFLVIQKFLFFNIGVKQNYYFYIGLVAIISLLLFFHIYYRKMLKKRTFQKNQKQGIKINVAPIVVMSSFGYIIAQLLMSSFVTDSLQLIVLILILAIFTVLTSFLSTWIQKYIFIKQNYDTVKKLRPDFNLSKSERENYIKNMR